MVWSLTENKDEERWNVETNGTFYALDEEAVPTYVWDMWRHVNGMFGWRDDEATMV